MKQNRQPRSALPRRGDRLPRRGDCSPRGRDRSLLSRVMDRAGFTLGEAIMVMGILVVLASAAIPSGMGAWRNVKQIQLNRCAEILYMTAQRNLAAAKVSGKSLSYQEVTSQPPSDTGNADKDLVLPANTISPDLYGGYWVIDYDKNNWTVAKAYYSETEAYTNLSEWEGKAAGGLGNGKVGFYGEP